MITTIKDFINSFDYSSIPIGPQSELLEEIDKLNSQIPYVFQPGQLDGYNGRLYSERGFPSAKFGVTKKFSWKNGTAVKLKAIKDYHDGIFLRKNYSVGSIKNLWIRPDRNKYNYQHKRFKDQVYRVDNMLKGRRNDGAIWLDDDVQLNAILEGLKDTISKAFTDFIDYVDKTPGVKSKCAIHYYNVSRSELIDQVTSISDLNLDVDNLLNEMWKTDNTDSHILFIKHHRHPNAPKTSMQYILDQSEVRILHQYPQLMMNVFHGDSGKVPVFKFPIGKIIVSLSISIENLIRFSLGQGSRARHYDSTYQMKTWHRPEINGLKHPYINMGQDRMDHRHRLLKDCNLRYNSSQGNCAGNMNFNQPISKLNFIGWSEETYTWVNTYRIGTTHPLNNITQAFYGNPTKIDPDLDDLYLDTIGWSTDRCHNHLSNYLSIATTDDMPDRMSICQNYCEDAVRRSCSGHKSDLIQLDTIKINTMFNEGGNIDRTYVHGDSFNIEPPPDSVLDNYYEPLHVAEEDSNSLEASMLTWINQQNGGEQ